MLSMQEVVGDTLRRAFPRSRSLGRREGWEGGGGGAILKLFCASSGAWWYPR